MNGPFIIKIEPIPSKGLKMITRNETIMKYRDTVTVHLHSYDRVVGRGIHEAVT